MGLPISAVTEKWLYYYWPLFESSVFIPQIRGESPGCAMPIAFRASLSELIQAYRGSGGLTRFVLDSRGATIQEGTGQLLLRVLDQVQKTIISGPVTFAGGSLSSGRVFRYDSKTREIRLSTSIWRELSLVGHWIQDAVILRWAELTSEISKKQLRPSEAIELLLTVPIPERVVADAKTVYKALVGLQCTWTGATIGKGLAVDHVIPFSLWHNNDLWNLVPTSPKANAAKRDKLPTRELLVRRRDQIIGYWEIVREARTSRFDHEAARIAGQLRMPDQWQGVVFQAVADAVEYTAVQRGYERWQP